MPFAKFKQYFPDFPGADEHCDAGDEACIRYLESLGRRFMVDFGWATAKREAQKEAWDRMIPA